MSRYPFARSVLPSLVLAATAQLGQAQRTWTVDLDNRPGTDFTQIQPAVDAARDGDTIVVRKSGGNTLYKAFTASKALTLLGENGPFITSMTVAGLAAGKAYTMKGFSFLGAFVLRNNTGRIHLAKTGGGALGFFSNTALDIRQCTQVTLNQCTFVGGSDFGPAVRIGNSTVVMTDTAIKGRDGQRTGLSAVLAAVGLQVSTSRVSVHGGRVDGGDGDKDLLGRTVPPERALAQLSGDTVLAGNAVITAGTPAGNSLPKSAIAAGDGTLTIDPRVKVLSASAVKISGPVKPTVTTVPSMSALGGRPGTLTETTTFGKAGQVAAVFVSFTANRVDTIFGDLWLDFASLQFLTAGVLDTAGELDVDVPFAPIWFRRGHVMRLQSFVGDGNGFKLALPGTVILD